MNVNLYTSQFITDSVSWLDTKNNTLLVKTMDSSIRILEHEFDVLPNVGEYL